MDALAARVDLVGKKLHITGKLQTDHGDLPPRLTVESFQQHALRVGYSAQPEFRRGTLRQPMLSRLPRLFQVSLDSRFRSFDLFLFYAVPDASGHRFL